MVLASARVNNSNLSYDLRPASIDLRALRNASIHRQILSSQNTAHVYPGSAYNPRRTP